METEAKYTVLDPAAAAEIAACPSIGGYPVVDVETRTITDTYLDTPSESLMAGGYACRARRGPDSVKINLKSVGAQAGVVHHREELAVAVGTGVIAQPSTWPSGRARQTVEKLAPGQSLVKLFQLEQERQIRHVLSDGGDPVAELSLDTVRGSGKGWSRKFCELEIELLPDGSRSQLDQMVEAIASTPGLTPQPTSKFERALVMAYHVSGTGNALDLGGVRPWDTMGEATRKLLRPLFLRMQVHESGTYDGGDPEELHDMRVMTRRMRTALRLARPYLEGDSINRISRDLRKMAHVLGAVRDMDVFRRKTEAYVQGDSGAFDALGPLMDAWNVAYAHRRNAMLSYLTSKRYGRFKQALWSQLFDRLPEGQPPLTVQRAVPSVVRDQLDALLAQGQEILAPNAPLSAYHQLRIELKHLRYTLRFFQDVLGPEVTPALKVLERLQDAFGNLQDAVVTVEHLRAVIAHGTWEAPRQADRQWRELSGDDHGRSPIAGVCDYLHHKETEIAAFLAAAPDLWREFSNANVASTVRSALDRLARGASHS